MKKYFIFALYIIIGLFVHVDSHCPVVSDDHFWTGFLHGIILPFSFIFSLSDDCSIITLGASFLYNLGFVLGATFCPILWLSLIEAITNPSLYRNER